MKNLTAFILSTIIMVTFTGINLQHTVKAAEESNILVAYFSATGTTEGLAESIQSVLGADIYKITPAVPYTSADLNYNSDCRANREQNVDSARPEIAGSIENIARYDAIFLGYPIWWGKAPKIIYTFLESYDLSEKMIIPFCTSGGSGISTSVGEIKQLEPNATVDSGRRFTSSSESTVKEWTDRLNLPAPKPVVTPAPTINIEGENVTVNGAPDNSSLILAFYKNSVLVNVSITKGSGTITDNISNKTNGANKMKGFLWDMETIKPLSDAVDLDISDRKNQSFDFNTKTVMLNSGYEMPINGLGTYSLHGDECINSVKSALHSGVRLIDTASAYGNEDEVGQAVREFMTETGTNREEIFVITKIYPGNEMANPEQSIQACLDRLNIGYVDMMLLHHPDTNDVKAYKAMEQFVKDGKIRSLGLSNWYIEELKTFLPQVDIKPALVQNEIHPYYQENDVIPFIQEQGIAVQGWYPLGGRGHTAELLGDAVISEIAANHGVSSAQVILRWNLQKGVVVIPGSSNPDHIKENTELYHFELTDAEMDKINALDKNEKHDWY